MEDGSPSASPKASESPRDPLLDKWKFMPPETAPGGCKWLNQGCSANSAFKATQPRFSKASHDLTPSTMTPEFRHLGPGYYNTGYDIHKPTIEQRAKGGKYIKGLFNPLQDTTERFGYTPYAMTTETQKPGYEHMGPGFTTPADYQTDFQKKSHRNAKLKNAAFGSNVDQPRIKPKSKHEQMMDKIWTRFDHIKAGQKYWEEQQGAYISPHEKRFPNRPPEIPEDETKERRKSARDHDQRFSERLRSIGKTGKPSMHRRRNQDMPTDEPPPESRTKGSALGGHQGVAWSVVKRFGHSPFEQKTEMQKVEMAHIGPGLYTKAKEATSIRARTAVSTNNSAAFVPGSPRFGRKRRVDVSDGGASRRAEKMEREKRLTEVNAMYGQTPEDDTRPKTTR